MDNFRGSVYMVLAMACFSVEDAFIKAAAVSLPLGQIIFIFGLFGTLAFILLTKQRQEKIFHPAILSRPIFIRSLCEVAGRLFFSISIVLIPLSTLSAILQSTPLIVVIGAALFFGEKVGWRRWTAIIIGFLGVLMIIRPGMDSFEPASIFAVLGTLGFAGRDLATRASPKLLSNMQLGIYGFFILMPVGVLILLFNKQMHALAWPSGIVSLQLLGTIIFGVTAYYSLTAAMRIGEISTIAPFRYTRLIFALIIGVTLFGERPDALTLLGSLIIVSGGIYTLWRTRYITQKISHRRYHI